MTDETTCPVCTCVSDSAEGGMCSLCESNWDNDQKVEIHFQALSHPEGGDSILVHLYLTGLRKLAKAIMGSIPCDDEPYDVESIAILWSAFEFMTGIPANDYRALELLDKYSEEG